MPPWWQALLQLLDTAGIDLPRTTLAWARVTPVIVLVPAFGLRALPAAARVLFALCLGALIAPGITLPADQSPWALRLVTELVRGLPIALTAAAVLWAANMAGGLADNLRGERATSDLPIVEPGSTPFGALLSMLTAVAFLQSGGANRAAVLLLQPVDPGMGLLQRAVFDLRAAIELSIAIAAPLVVAAIVIELASALVARAMVPALVQPALQPVKSLVVLAAVAVLLDRIVSLLSLHASRTP